MLDLLFLAADEVLTIPTHNDTLLYTMNGGAIVTIISLTVWMIKTEIPRREQKNAEERERLRMEFSNLLGKMIDNFRVDVQMLTKAFTDEMHLERQSHTNEMQYQSTSLEKMVNKIEARLSVLEFKKSE